MLPKSLLSRECERAVLRPNFSRLLWRWVQRYAPELNQRYRRELKPTNGSWRVDETYICQRNQAADQCQPRFSIVRWSLADDSRLRGTAHDPERPGEVVAERGCPWADSVHPGNPRIEKLNSRLMRLAIGSVPPTELFLQHNQNAASVAPALPYRESAPEHRPKPSGAVGLPIPSSCAAWRSPACFRLL